MSQAQLAKELHMNTEAYRRIEVGKVNIPIEILYELENKFDIPATVKESVKAGADIENTANQTVHVYLEMNWKVLNRE